ncbi:DNA-3-methyladenine glycosylase [Clavibacter nebraskensis]|uniref:Putative 3-methyladenine DNA glycosylase n=4 Tax=Clavibacter nebraskensis TaxID=31963 RepID=A0AAI9EKR2_9MICO|nr:DNA-3-methyladenine glycosylase [Clavibacter nebraskensis]KXU20144.1 3-methyladenine DNA glycosylase [Clavibacter nebraskensis]OAH21580.1 3-methyladenine DNA glycosylase [Clavibacter nebraskensis]QGV67082.1 DNA-3-methyladenine glycosylase [Clavibacter nebraskensis]QGV69879.1 DNA-3-methyladenine glycosylase [Clavibacter nebraskensis]QGV72670.1 DNA-3-methyladenine glycosylase [Clavibacter nebraskensis]
MIDAAFFARDAVEVAPALLGAILSRDSEEGRVAVRLTEVEAYRGVGEDPGSHAFRGKRARNATMFGPPAHLYAYFTYGMHTCANIVCGPEGMSAGVLLRAGEVIEGADLARSRRGAAVRDRDLARGPARLTVALGIPLSDDGAALDAAPYGLVLPDAPLALPASGPRVGVSGPGGSGELFPWRFWVPGDPTVSPYRAHVARVRR